MAEIIPIGVDNVTGQSKPFVSGDTLVDAAGDPILAPDSQDFILASQIFGRR